MQSIIVFILMILCLDVTLALKVSAVRFYDPPNSDPDQMSMGYIQVALDSGTNWLPVCELSYHTSELACDMLMPNSYDMFVAGSTVASRDIAGVGECVEITCSDSDTSLSDCTATISIENVMISYLICLDKPLNRKCWITDSNMPMYCVDPKNYDTWNDIFSYGGFAIIMAFIILVMLGFLIGDAQRITSQKKQDEASTGSGKRGNIIGMARTTPKTLK